MTAGLIDTNAYVGRWPFRRLPDDETALLVAKLRRHGFAQAWVGSFEGLLQKDVAAVNERLARECRAHGRGLLVPFGTVNPTLPDWQEQARLCRDVHRMPGIRLHPSYHGYGLGDPRLSELLALSADLGLIVQIALRIEDERTQNALARAPYVDVAPLAELAARYPKLRLVLQNAFPSLKSPPRALTALAGARNVYVDIATLEGMAGIAALAKEVPLERILFGSLAPFFYFEAALLKLKESALSMSECRAICELNAARLRLT